MRKHLFTKPSICGMLLLVATAASLFASSPRSRWDDEAAARKLDYIYMEAQRQSALEDLDAEFALYRRAYDLDTTDTGVGSELAIFYLSLAEAGDQYEQTGFDLVRRQFLANPKDLRNGYIYGRLNRFPTQRAEALHVWDVLDSLNPGRDELKLQLVDALIAMGDTLSQQRAITLVEQIEESVGVSDQFTSRIAYAMMQQNDTAGAIKSIHRLLERAPQIANNHVFAGKFFMSIGRPDSAIVYFDRACAVDSTSGYAYFTRADYYRQMNDSAAFNRETTHALLYTDLDLDVKTDIMLNYVREFYNDSTLTSTIDSLFDKLLNQYPHEGAFRDIYSSYLFTLGRYSEAAEMADLAVDANPADTHKWGQSVAAHLLAKETDKAIDAGRRAVSYHPGDLDLTRVYIGALIDGNEYEEAIKEIDRAISLSDTLDRQGIASLMGSKGDLFSRLERNDSAIACYNRALEIDPGSLLVMNNLAYHLSCLDIDLDRAEQLSAVTVREEPDNPTYLDTYAWVLFHRGEYDKAKIYIDRAIIHAQEEPQAEIFEHAGDIYFLLDDKDNALEFWEKALELDPDNPTLKEKVKTKNYLP